MPGRQRKRRLSVNKADLSQGDSSVFLRVHYRACCADNEGSQQFVDLGANDDEAERHVCWRSCVHIPRLSSRLEECANQHDSVGGEVLGVEGRPMCNQQRINFPNCTLAAFISLNTGKLAPKMHGIFILPNTWTT